MSDKSNNIFRKNELPKNDITKIGNSTVSNVQKENEIIAVLRKKRIESMTDEEIIEENLKSILDIKSREERKANGRLIAVLVAFLVIFLAIYHAWIRKTAVLAGVLVPAAIMLGYGGWVVVLAKRDKRKRVLFEKHLEEVALKNKKDLEKKAIKQARSSKTKVHFENEIPKKERPHKTADKSSNAEQTITVQIEDHRKQRKRRDNGMALASQMLKDGYGRRPSIAQKIFGQTPVEHRNINTKLLKENEVLVHEKRKKLKRMDTLPMPQIARIESAP